MVPKWLHDISLLKTFPEIKEQLLTSEPILLAFGTLIYDFASEPVCSLLVTSCFASSRQKLSLNLSLESVTQEWFYDKNKLWSAIRNQLKLKWIQIYERD